MQIKIGIFEPNAKTTMMTEDSSALRAQLTNVKQILWIDRGHVQVFSRFGASRASSTLTPSTLGDGDSSFARFVSES